jgi:hypothetical protein
MALSDAERQAQWRKRQPTVEVQCARCGKIRRVSSYPRPGLYCQPCAAGLSIKRRGLSFRPSLAGGDETIDDRLAALNRDKD